VSHEQNQTSELSLPNGANRDRIGGWHRQSISLQLFFVQAQGRDYDDGAEGATQSRGG
jgi:hypothetical protein